MIITANRLIEMHVVVGTADSIAPWVLNFDFEFQCSTVARIKFRMCCSIHRMSSYVMIHNWHNQRNLSKAILSVHFCKPHSPLACSKNKHQKFSKVHLLCGFLTNSQSQEFFLKKRFSLIMRCVLSPSIGAKSRHNFVTNVALSFNMQHITQILC